MDIPKNAAYFFWQGQKSTDYGIVLTSNPTITFAGQRYNSYEVDGISGSTFKELGYQTYELSLDIAVVDVYASSTYSENALTDKDYLVRKQLQKFLWRGLSGQGLKHGKLFLSRDIRVTGTIPNFTYYDAKLLNVTELVPFGEYYTCTLTFECQPFKNMGQDATTDPDNPVYEISLSQNMLTGGGNSFYVPYACSSQFGIHRQPYFYCDMNQDVIIDILNETSGYTYMMFYLRAQPINTYDLEYSRKVATRRAVFFSVSKIKTLLETFTNINLVRFFIDIGLNKYYIAVLDDNNDYLKYIDISYALVLPRAISTVFDNAFTDVVYEYNEATGTVKSYFQQENYSIPFRCGQSTSTSGVSTTDRVNVYLYVGTESISAVSFGTLTYFPNETVL